MRASALFSACAFAQVLAIPASAAPLAVSSMMNAPGMSPVTMQMTGPTEIPNLPMQNLAMPNMNILRRGADFRQADYGVNSDATLFPVQQVPATPTVAAVATAQPSRRDDAYGASYINSYHYDVPSKGVSAAAVPDTSASNALSNVQSGSDLTPGSNLASDSGSGSTSGSGPDSGSSSSSGSPLGPLNLSGGPIKMAAVPVNLAGNGLKIAAAQRYPVSNAFHNALGSVFNTRSNTALLANSEGTGLVGGLQPASVPFVHPRDVTEEAKRFVSRHSMQLDTNALLPPPRDPNLNMSDPVVAQEVARQHNVGLINIDSNQMPKPPAPHALPALSASPAPQALSASPAFPAASYSPSGLPFDMEHKVEDKEVKNTAANVTKTA